MHFLTKKNLIYCIHSKIKIITASDDGKLREKTPSKTVLENGEFSVCEKKLTSFFCYLTQDYFSKYWT